MTSTVAVFLPSFLVLLGVAPHYDRWRELVVIRTMVRGVLAAFVGLLVFLLYQFARVALVDWKTWTLAICVLLALRRGMGLPVVVGLTAAISLLVF